MKKSATRKVCLIGTTIVLLGTVAFLVYSKSTNRSIIDPYYSVDIGTTRYHEYVLFGRFRFTRQEVIPSMQVERGVREQFARAGLVLPSALSITRASASQGHGSKRVSAILNFSAASGLSKQYGFYKSQARSLTDDKIEPDGGWMLAWQARGGQDEILIVCFREFDANTGALKQERLIISVSSME